MPFQWGIVGAGKISQDFVTALKTIKSDDGQCLHEVVAVASSSLSKSEDFCRRFGIPVENALGSYLEIASCERVQAVYIGTVHPLHLEHARIAMGAGKAVLSEKPITVNSRELKEMIACAKQNNVFLMEALWSRFLPSYCYIREAISAGAIGEPLCVNATFGFSMPEGAPIERLVRKELAGGALLDLGIYVMNVALTAFNDAKPEKIAAAGHLFDSGVDHTVGFTLSFSGGRTATFMVSCNADLPCEAFICGSKGQLKLPKPFWCATEVEHSDGSKKSFPLPATSDPFNFFNSCGLRYEAEEVRQCVEAGRKESSIMSHEHSLLFMSILDELRRQVGYSLPQDSA
ncbi:trans-1,2-dihydrobenzene-1,2-diol dehydrogenase-like [Sycon ciliatum]|uniref:trans-1,2-dihydrobenzene-1,2-diol dehydrogenase-like n=1 Tax=Sycon ciliatum TaxID=27933 RepID=UPI0020AE428D|eukprot:scpid30783/ scgid30581/ Trans-1,2-dihydrobenzene-1,2-diol dehydrogenase; D-xylose 1-dehydrogenase; D-xylose-NADP dehydrogenase; Dimeric dihydrodiol dehydrogenase